MGNINQAPTLLYSGDKMNDPNKMGFAQRSHYLESCIWNGLDAQDTAPAKVMFYLTGNCGDGNFKVSEAGICQRTNLSKSGYLKARKKLEEMGWIIAENNSIIVDFDAIYNFDKESWKQGKNKQPELPKNSNTSTTQNCVVSSTTQNNVINFNNLNYPKSLDTSTTQKIDNEIQIPQLPKNSIMDAAWEAIKV